MPITQQQLTSIISPTNFTVAVLQQITDSLNQTFVQFQMNTPLRMCHFLAQVLHESGKFRYTAEIWGPTPAQNGYEGRKDLGNTQPGDGFRFRGRGWIQLTGRTNYQIVSADLKQDFVTNPDLVGQYPWAAVIAGWYWNKHGLNAFADTDDITTITKRINGGLNGFDDRKAWLAKAKTIIQ